MSTSFQKIAANPCCKLFEQADMSVEPELLAGYHVSISPELLAGYPEEVSNKKQAHLFERNVLMKCYHVNTVYH